MPTKYQKRDASFSNARLDDTAIYRKILQLYFAGFPPQYIATQVSAEPQTVNRNLKKIRHNLIWQKRLNGYLTDEALKAGFQHIDLYLWLAQNLMFVHANGRSGAVRHCLTKCPLALNPKAFNASHVDATYIDHEYPHPISPERKLDTDYDGLFGQFDIRARCKACPMGSERNVLPTAFRDFPELYLDLMYYFEHNRVASDDEFFFHASMATYIGAVRRIAAHRLAKSRRRGLKDKIGDKMVARKVLRMANRIYDLMALSPSDPETMLESFRYASGAPKGFPPG
ncbi:MAG: hypothetical protein AAGA09_03185 [Pseudomonadota bacterium]